MIDLLLTKVSNDLLDRPGSDGVLHHAASGNRPENTEYLLQKLANLRLYDIPGCRGNYPLHYAATSGNIDAVAALLKREGISINSRNEDGQTPLHLATDGNLIDVCSILLKAGANVNAKDNNGSTPL
ncbi:ankyrin, partial [Hypoxylon sp. EC38]